MKLFILTLRAAIPETVSAECRMKMNDYKNFEILPCRIEVPRFAPNSILRAGWKQKIRREKRSFIIGGRALSQNLSKDCNYIIFSLFSPLSSLSQFGSRMPFNFRKFFVTKARREKFVFPAFRGKETFQRFEFSRKVLLKLFTAVNEINTV